MSKRLIYADHAATTPLSKTALEAMLPFLQGEFGNPSSLHAWSRVPKKAVAEARATIAECINATPEEIFFTSGGTEADNWVIKGSTGGLMVSSYEHHAILNAAASEAANGRLVTYAKPKMGGYVTPDKITEAWQDGIKLVSIMAANNEIGSLNTLEWLSEHIHRKGALFHTDAVQAVGHVSLDVKDAGVDFLSASAHKFNGPRGIGFLFKRKDLELKPLLNGGQQEFGIRAGTENVAAIVGMAAALKENCDNLDANEEYLNKLRGKLMLGLFEMIPDVHFPGSEMNCQLPGFLSVTIPGQPAEGLTHILDLKGIAVSAGAACDSKNTQISHVLKAIHLPSKLAMCTIRISLGIENTLDDVDQILSAIKSIIKRKT